ncbi:MAG: hypothetical protein GXO22_06070 [Aquificae bacterium]|nr:hypothetical protein [Aquificota bacterium]
MIEALANVLHVLGVLIWIGGMFYTLFVFRPSLQILKPEERLNLVLQAMGRFFRYVWIAILLLFLTGAYRVHLHIHSYLFEIKLIIYFLMVAVFSYIYFFLYKKLPKIPNLEKPNLINKIIVLIKLNFGLGLLVILLIELYKKGV